MTQHSSSSEWISAYLEWTDSEVGTTSQRSAFPVAIAGANGGEDIAAIYLEWIDSAPAQHAATAFAAEPLREAVLLMALRTESECMHILRQALDDGRPTSQTLRLALDNVEADVRALSGRILELRAH